MLLLATVFFFGVLHGLGPDHLAAITIFGSQGRNSSPHRLTFFATRFALGHALVIAVAGIAAKLGGSLLSPVAEARFDVAGGLLLVLTGIALILGLATGRLTLHSHQHAHDAGQHRHLHFHMLHRTQHRHGHGTFAFVIGAFFALGGFRALLTIAPIALAPALLQSVLRIAAFTLGIIISMTLYGLVSASAWRNLSRTSTLTPLWHNLSSYGVAIFSLVAGLLTLHEHLG